MHQFGYTHTHTNTSSHSSAIMYNYWCDAVEVHCCVTQEEKSIKRKLIRQNEQNTQQEGYKLRMLRPRRPSSTFTLQLLCCQLPLLHISVTWDSITIVSNMAIETMGTPLCTYQWIHGICFCYYCEQVVKMCKCLLPAVKLLNGWITTSNCKSI